MRLQVYCVISCFFLFFIFKAALTEITTPKEIGYSFRCDLYEGSEIHKFKTFSDMHVEVCIGSHVVKSERMPVKNGRCEWYQCLNLEGKNTEGK